MQPRCPEVRTLRVEQERKDQDARIVSGEELGLRSTSISGGTCLACRGLIFMGVSFSLLIRRLHGFAERRWRAMQREMLMSAFLSRR